MNLARRPPSMADVALIAHVSHQTVSRVLNAHPSVRPETRQRVLDAVAELGYRRNSAARALVTRRTDTIGVLTTGSALYGPISTLVALEEAAREAGMFVSVATLRQFDPPPWTGCWSTSWPRAWRASSSSPRRTQWPRPWTRSGRPCPSS